MSDGDPPRRLSWFGRPELPIWFVVLTLFGVGAAFVGLPEDWSVPVRVMAGVALGAGATVAVFANRMIGGRDF